MGTANLILGDCIEKMREMSVGEDLILITDPPYGILNGKTNFGSDVLAKAREYPKITWDCRPPREWFDLVFRISRGQIIFGGNYFSEYLPPTNAWYIWDKLRPEGTMYSAVEMIWTSFKFPAKKIPYLWNGMLKEQERLPEPIYHPTQKPVAIMEYLIKRHTKENETVFDPFMGSGTTGVAALRLNRNFIGIEIDPTYFAIAEKRIKIEKEQTRLF